MRPITIKNEYGETIDIKWDTDGTIRLRHSDIDSKAFGEFHECSKRFRQPKLQEFLAQRGIDANSPEAKEFASRMGGYIVLRGKSYIISAEETALVLEAIKKAGGIVPNWSSRP